MTPNDFDQWLKLPAGTQQPLVMGVLNVTPDSFSDGGRFTARDAAVSHAQAMAADGADLIDVGGESTRPGSQPVSPDEQLRRIVPVLQDLASRLAIAISIDTRSAVVARAALDAGATLVNDISGGRDDPEMFPLVARRGVPVVLMHMLGTPQTMQQDPTYPDDDVVAALITFLKDRLAAATACGIERRKVLLDPGIGFGKTTSHNLQLLRATRALAQVGQALVVGPSRKRFIGTITDEPEPGRRQFGTAAAVAWAVTHGAGIVRVHDVREMAQVVRMTRAIQFGADSSRDPFTS
jgi:dihydropteroate synthase